MNPSRAIDTDAGKPLSPLAVYSIQVERDDRAPCEAPGGVTAPPAAWPRPRLSLIAGLWRCRGEHCKGAGYSPIAAYLDWLRFYLERINEQD